MDELARALDALSSLVRNCYGPCAEDALLFAPPDPPVVTADGHALLMAWRRGLRENNTSREPMQMFVLNAAESLYLQIGDGTSEFVLLLHGAVKHAVDAIRQTRSQWRAEKSFRQLATAFGDLKRECEHLLADCSMWQPDLRVVTPINFKYNSSGLKPSREFHDATMDILRSGLSGLLGEQALKSLICLVVEWLFTPPIVTGSEDHKVDAQLLFQHVQQFLKRAPDMITFALAYSVFGSQVVPSGQFILRKSLVPSQLPSILRSTNADSPLRFVCLTCELSLTSGANHVTIHTNTSDDLFSAADATRLFITKYLSALHNMHNVRLLVSTEQVEDAVVAICTRLGIACVQSAEKSDMFDLCAAAQVHPLASLFDEIHDNLHIGICSEGVTSVRLQQSANLWFHGLSRAKNEFGDDKVPNVVVVPQLLLKAPTKGAYKQYCKVIVKALRILRSWREPSVQVPTASSQQQQQSQFELYSCRGGGATELAVARHLDKGAKADSVLSNGDSIAGRLARKIFASALSDVVVILRSNMSATAASSSSSDEHNCDDDDALVGRVSKRIVVQDMARMALHDDAAPLHGYVLSASHTIETMAGPICIPELVFGDPRQFGLLHPWKRIDALLLHVLQTLEQLFRVDCILHTSHKVRKDDDAAEE